MGFGSLGFEICSLGVASFTQPTCYGDASYAVMESSAASEPAPIAGGEQRIEMVAKGAIELIK